MELSATKRNRIFWLLQFLGWGFINAFSFFLFTKVSLEFIIFSILSGIFIGVFTTSLLRNYLKKQNLFDQFGLKEILKIAISTVLCSALYGSMSFAAGFFYGKYMPTVDEIEIKILENYNSFWLIAVNSLFIIFVWVVCYLVIKLLLKLNADRIERLELNTTLKQAQLNTLKGQINPHFMFNSLNNIRGLMLEDVEKSRDMLTKLSEMLRYSLTQNDGNAIALEQELEMVENYIDLSKIQFEDRLRFEKDIDPKSLHLSIPPMIVQLLVENGTKHGISKLKQGGTIALKTNVEEDQLTIRVSNTGSLKMGKNTTQLGLKNIRQRLRLLYGERATFGLKEENGEVVATIKIPLS
ncbi:sensor histidine kinase [Poritiphilus flavus]|uniref:Histidine kinase n=1 Tax=Poritiphilus flavus TaxID=2697053 RepID=A0A6L9EHC8_9FLAO|nr:histidine kinase [Poritiphilus flavus]NAS14174.1 histidine kinase [Poritiphilus flavus]